MKYNNLFLMLAACLCWSLDAIWRYPLMNMGYHPIHIVWFEHLVLLSIFLIFRIKSFKLIFQSSAIVWISFLVVGGIGSAIATASFTQAFFYLNPSIVILLQKVQPFLTVLFSWIFLKETLKFKFAFWGFLTMLGATLTCYDPGWFNGLFWNYNIGYVFTFIAVIGWSLTTVFGKKLTNSGLPVSSILCGRFFIGFVTLSMFMPFISLQKFGPDEVLKICLIVLISGLMGMYFYYKAMMSLKANQMALYELFFPLISIIVNWVILGKSLNLIQLVGAFLICLSAYKIETSRQK